jgi:hypothetical protein
LQIADSDCRLQIQIADSGCGFRLQISNSDFKFLYPEIRNAKR